MQIGFLSTLAAGVLAAGLAHAQDAAQGGKVFKKCKSCHMVGEGAKNRVGPNLTGVIGRPAGSMDGYKYSKSMLAAGTAGLLWHEDNVFA